MHKETGKITAMSNKMEKKEFIKILQMFEGENITSTQITADHHTQGHKYMREKEPDINHQFDT